MELKDLIHGDLHRSPTRSSEPTDLDAYILTPAEEEIAINHARYLKFQDLKWKYRKDLSMISDEMVEIDEKEVLQRANRRKHQDLIMEGYREAKRIEDEEKEKQRLSHWTARQMYRHLAQRCLELTGNNFEFDEGNSEYITKICHFLANTELPELGLDLKKGLWIKGNVGRGKTFPLQCLSDNGLNAYSVFSVSKIIREIRETGEFELPARLVVLDDVGTEPMAVKYYGSEINWFKDLIEERSQDPALYNRLIISTNLSFDDVEVCYGERVRSRIAQMFNVIDVTGEDRRRQR